MSTLAFHPLANIFPLLEGRDFEELVADISWQGLLEPVVMHEGKILDGRNRYRACEAAGVACRFETYTGDDPVSYVISLNLKRRHLDESQRAMVAAKLATLRDGQRADLVEGLPIGRAADLLNVGERSVARAREVIDHGAPELQQAVERGEVAVSTAADVASLPAEEQGEIVARGEREILEAARRIRAERAETRRSERVQNLIEISKGNSGLPAGRYPIILADPPWLYEHPPFSESRKVENHYPTLAIDEICALQVSELSAPDALLFIWSPPPILEQCFQVIRAWGFEYRTGLVWTKDKIGMGMYVRQQHEHLLIARRGEIPLPAPHARPPSIIQAPRREHSRKPDEVYALIERMYPTLPKIELFARSRRDGWQAWGNEAPAAIED